MLLLFYADGFLMLSPSKYKIDDFCASLQEHFKIGGDGDLNKYLGIELDDC